MPEDRRVAPHRLARVDLDASAVADDDDAAVFGEQAEIAIEVDVRGHLEDEVDAAAAGRAHDLVGVVRRAVIDDDVGAVLADRLRGPRRCRRCR